MWPVAELAALVAFGTALGGHSGVAWTPCYPCAWRAACVALQQWSVHAMAQGVLAQVWVVHHDCEVAAVGSVLAVVFRSQSEQVRVPRVGQRGPEALGWGGMEIATSTLLRSAVVARLFAGAWTL